MEEAVTACGILFSLRFHLAAVVAGQIRPADIKIASTRLIQSQVPKGVDLRTPENRAYLSVLARIARACRVLLRQAARDQQRRLQDEMDAFVRRDEWIMYTGRLPRKRLRLAEYLYFRGAISRQMLEHSLAWQKRKRPLMGQIAMERGYVTPRQFAEVLCRLERGEMFGEKAREMGLLTNGQVSMILAQQESHGCPVGAYFVRNGLLSREQLDEYLGELRIHNRAYGGA